MSVMLPRDDGVTLLRLPFHLNDVGNVERQFALRPVGTFRLVVSVGTATTGFFNNPTVWYGGARRLPPALLPWGQRTTTERSAQSSAPG
jgi:hypothetical protein